MCVLSPQKGEQYPTFRVRTLQTTSPSFLQDHYHFVAGDVMEKWIAAGKFVAHARVHDYLYGTSWDAVRAVGEDCRICVLDIDIQVGSREPDSHLFEPHALFSNFLRPTILLHFILSACFLFIPPPPPIFSVAPLLIACMALLFRHHHSPSTPLAFPPSRACCLARPFPNSIAKSASIFLSPLLP